MVSVDDTRRRTCGKSVGTSIKQVKTTRLEQLLELNAVRESERQRLARELHDRLGQDITALALGLRSLKRKSCITPEVIAELEQLQVIVGQLDQQVHDIAWELRPLIIDDLGLQAALQSLLEKWSAATNIPVSFQCKGLQTQVLPEAIETSLYRIAQEALTNISKHAEANQVLVSLAGFKGRAVMIITDDGKGFDVTSTKIAANNNECLGLIGMAERVELFSGMFDIISVPDNGTSVKITIPLQPQKKR